MKSAHCLSSAKIKELTASEDHASCWVHKVLTVMILETNSGFVDKSKGVGWKGLDSECQVRLTGIKREYWMGIDSYSIHIYRAVYEVHMHIYICWATGRMSGLTAFLFSFNMFFLSQKRKEEDVSKPLISQI